jgi:signal peptidase I
VSEDSPDAEVTNERDQAIGADPFAEDGGADEAGEIPEEERTRSRRSFWMELPVLIVVALVVAVLIKTFLVQAFFIPSASMRETLVENDRVMVNKLAYRFGDPSPGQIIVFDSPLEDSNRDGNLLTAIIRNIGEALGLSAPDSALIKRVVAVGGQTVEIRGGTLFVDGAAVDEPYLDPGLHVPDFGAASSAVCPPFTTPAEPSGCTVDAGHVFVLGDNRNQSEDSRRFGAIPEGSVVGRAFVRVWPPSRWGGL